MDSACIIIFLSVISHSFSAIVQWLPSTSFNLPINFDNGKLPCSKQIVIFPETVNSSIIIESETLVNGFILPIDGEFYLEDGIIEFGPSGEDNCTEGYEHFVDKSYSSWNRPDVWDSPKFNKATPDAERVPCYDDIVEFPTDKGFSVILPDKTQKLRGITIADERYDTVEFKDYVLRNKNQLQQFYFNKYDDTGIVIEFDFCKSPAGCPCQKEVLDIDCEAKFCPIPSCVEPIQPIGHCCKICGGILIYKIDQSFRLFPFKEQVEETLSSYGENELVYHIGRIPDDQIQLIIVENGEYTGRSAEVVNNIANRIKWHLGSQMQISGIPFYKSGMGSKIFISIFFIVIIMMGTVYLYYYKLPDVRFPVIGRGNFTMFSRYDRRSESVVSLTRRSSVVPIGSGAPTAFRNPLYDSKRSKSSVESIGDQ